MTGKIDLMRTKKERDMSISERKVGGKRENIPFAPPQSKF
jgi:hypothetical protein